MPMLHALVLMLAGAAVLVELARPKDPSEGGGDSPPPGPEGDELPDSSNDGEWAGAGDLRALRQEVLALGERLDEGPSTTLLERLDALESRLEGASAGQLETLETIRELLESAGEPASEEPEHQPAGA